MCRDDGEPEIGYECDYCVGYKAGYDEGISDGSRQGVFHNVKPPAQVDARVAALVEKKVEIYRKYLLDDRDHIMAEWLAEQSTPKKENK